MDNTFATQISSTQFNEELQGIRGRLTLMGKLSTQQLALAIDALLASNHELAEQAIEHETALSALAIGLEEQCAKLLSSGSGSAKDLRLLLAVLKISNELEAICSLTTRIANNVLTLCNASLNLSNSFINLDASYALQHLANLVQNILQQTVDTVANMQGVQPVPNRAVLNNIDREYNSLLRQFITQMLEDPQHIPNTIDILASARALERIGDHACYIGRHLRCWYTPEQDQESS